MGFIPVYLSIAYPAILQNDLGNPFKLTPSPCTELLSKPHNIMNISTCCNYPYFFDLANYFEMHREL
jgi:hypothetical protein